MLSSACLDEILRSARRSRPNRRALASCAASPPIAPERIAKRCGNRTPRAHAVHARLDQRSACAAAPAPASTRRGAHALKRAVFFHRLGEIRDRLSRIKATRLGPQPRSPHHSLNTVYLGRPSMSCVPRRSHPNELVAHIAPLGWSTSLQRRLRLPDEPSQQLQTLRNPGDLLDAA